VDLSHTWKQTRGRNPKGENEKLEEVREMGERWLEGGE
jgi:hypothetical protein